MRPDIERAALAATETLIRSRVSYAPVSPLPILKVRPGVLVLSYAEMAETIGVDRSCVLGNLNTENHDASTAYGIHNGRPHYVVAYNQRLPTFVVHRALARELGHIVLGHDGSRPDDVRNEEAVVFARYLLFPRPLIRALQDAGVTVSQEMLGNVTGCYDKCQACLRETPGAHVPRELNQLVREQFAAYVANLIDYYPMLTTPAAPADLGTYMDHYEE